MNKCVVNFKNKWSKFAVMIFLFMVAWPISFSEELSSLRNANVLKSQTGLSVQAITL
jgi:hypothetical protein